MTDIAMFGLGFESSGIKEAEKRLNDLDKAGKKTQSVLDESSKSSENLDKKTSKLSDSIDKSSDVLNKNTTAIDRNGNKISEADVALGRFKDTHGRMRESNGQLVKGLSHTDEALGRVSKSANKASSMLGKLSGVMGGISAVALGRGMLSMAFNFDDAMNTVQSKLLITGQEMESLKDKARELGATTAFSATEAGQGMAFLAQAGLTANQILTATPTVLNLAAASGMDLARSADIATNVMGQFKLSVDDLPSIVDTLAMTSASANTSVEEMAYAFKQTGSVSKAFGVNLQDTSAIIGMLANNGIKSETAGMAMKNMFARLSGANSEANKILEKFKLSSRDLFDVFKDGTVKFKGIKNMFDLLNKSGMDVSQQMRLFGAEAGPALLSITKSGDDIEALAEKISKSGAASEMAELRMQGLVGVSKIARSTWEALNLTLADKGGRAIAISGLESLISVMQSVMDNTKEWGVGIAALAAIIMRSQIVAVSAAIKSNWLLVTSSIAATKAQYNQAASSGVLGRASATAAIAVRGLSGAMSLLGGPLGVITLAATALFTYKEEIIKAISQTGQLETATSDLNKITKKAKERAYEYADATDTVKESLEKQTIAEINSAKAKLEATKANVALAQSNLARAKSLDKIGSDDPFHTSLTDTRERELAAEMKIMQAQQNTIDEVISALNNFGKTKTQLNDIYKRSNKPIKEETKSTDKLVESTDKLGDTKDKKLSAYERELQAVTKAKIAKTEGAEAAYRYGLSLQKITGKQADFLVSLKKQSGAWQQVKSDFEKEKEALTKSTKAKAEGELAAYKYAISLKSITDEEQKLLIGLKKQEIAYKLAEENRKKAKKKADDAAKAKADEAKKIEDFYNSEIVGLSGTIIKRNQGEEALYRYELAQNKVTGSQADFLVNLKKQSGAWSDNKTSYEKAKESSDKFKSSSKNLGNELIVLEEKIVGNNDAARLLELQYSGLNEKHSENILALEKEKEASESLLSVNKKFADLNKENANQLAVLNEKLKGTNESARLLELTQQKYSETQAKKIVSDEKEKESIEALISAREKYNNLINESANKIEVLKLKIQGNTEAARLLELTNKKYSKTQAQKIIANEKEEKQLTKQLSVKDKVEKSSKDLIKQEKLLTAELLKGTEAAQVKSLVLDGYSKKQAEAEVADRKRVESIKDLISMSETLAQSLTDNIINQDLSGFGNTLVDTFKKDILNPVIENAIKPFSKAIANSMASVGNSISGALGGSKSLFGQGGAGIGSMIKQGGFKGALAGAGMGAGVASMLGGDTKGGAIGGAIGSIWGPIGSAVGSFIGSKFKKIFGGEKSVQGQGVALDYSVSEGFKGQTYTDMKKSGGWFKSSKYWTDFKAIDKDVQDGLNNLFYDVKKTLTSQAEFFNEENAALLISSFKTGLIKISGEGDMSKEIEKWSKGVVNELYESVFKSKFSGMANEGEELADTVSRVINQLDSVKQGFDSLGITFTESAFKAAEIADTMTKAAGSLDNLKASMQSYYDVVYSDEDKRNLSVSQAKERIDAYNKSIGLSGDSAIDSAEELKRYVEFLSENKEKNAEAIVKAMELSSSIATFAGTAQDAADKAQEAADKMSESFEQVAKNADRLKDEVSRLTDSLYSSSTSSYNDELKRYEDINKGVKSLTKTAKELLGVADIDKGGLVENQKEYLKLLDKVKSGDIESISDLQNAAKSLKDSLINEFADGERADSGIKLISSQLINASELLAKNAGNAPTQVVIPESERTLLTGQDRKLLAESLVNSMSDLSLATEQSISDLMKQNNVNIAQLSNDLGVDLRSISSTNRALSQDELNVLTSLSGKLGLTTLQLSEQLKINTSSITKTVSNSLSSLPRVPDNIKNSLAPYLSAIESANDYSELSLILNAVNNHISTLPAHIRDRLKLELDTLGLNIQSSLKNLYDLDKDKLTELASLYKINTVTIDNALKGNTTALVTGLSVMSKDFNADINQLTTRLGIDLGELKKSMSEGLGLVYNETKNNSNNTSDINTEVSDLNSVTSSKLNELARLFGISDKLIKNSLDETKNTIKETFKIPEKYLTETRDNISSFGNKVSDAIKTGDSSLLYMLRELSKTFDTSSVDLAKQLGYDIKSIVNPLTKTFNSLPSFIKHDLEPLLSAIKDSNDYSDLEQALKLTYNYINTLPTHIQNVVKPSFDQFNLSNNRIKTSIDSLSVLTDNGLSKLKENFGISSENIENAVSGSGDALFSSLQSMSKLFNTDIFTLGSRLNISNEAIKSAISSGLSNIPLLPDSIKELLKPLLKDIESSNDNADLRRALSGVSSIIASLPNGVSSSLSGALNSINIAVSNSSGVLTDKLSDMAKSLNTDLMTLAEKLGINSSVISQAIENNLSSLGGIPNNIRDGLAPYLKAIKDSNDYSSLEKALKLTSDYIGTLPSDIQSIIKPSFDQLDATNNKINSSVGNLSNVTNSSINKLKESFNISSNSIKNAVSGSGSELFNSLQSMSKAFNLDILTLGNKLNISNEAIKGAINSGLSDIPSLPENIEELLKPLLQDIKLSNNNAELKVALESVSRIISSLPSGISSNLNSVLSSIDSSVNNSGKVLINELSNLAKLLGTDILSLSEDIGVSSKSIAAAIESNLSSLDGIPDNIKSGLAPYLESIKNSNDYTSLKSSLNEANKHLDSLPAVIRDKLSKELNSIVKSNNSTSEEVRAASLISVSQLKGMAKTFNTDIVSLAEIFGVKTSDISTTIEDEISKLNSIPANIKSGLSPYLKEIKDSNNYTSLDNSIKSLEGYLVTLPSDIRTKLSSKLNDIVGTTRQSSQSIYNAVMNGTRNVVWANKDVSNSIDTSSLLSANKLKELSKDLKVNLLSLSEKLGVNSSIISKSISDNLSSVTNIPSDIKNELESYLVGIRDSNNYSTLESALNKVSLYINTLPDEIKDKLNKQLSNIVDANSLVDRSVKALTEINKDELIKLANSVISNNSSANNNTASILDGLSSIAKSFNTDLTGLAGKLKIDLSNVSRIISYELKSIESIPDSIKNELSSYLIDIKNSNNFSSLNTAINNLKKHIDSLPSGIKEKLDDRLKSISSNTEHTALATTGIYTQNKQTGDTWTFSAEAGILPDEPTSDVRNISAEAGLLPNELVGDTWNFSAESGVLPASAAIMNRVAESGFLPDDDELKNNQPEQTKINNDKYDTINAELLAEIKELKESQKAANYQLAKNTRDTYRLLDRWEGAGLPAERVTA